MFEKLFESLKEKISDDLFHISWKSLGSNVTFIPRIPTPEVTVGEEDEITPRVSLAPTISNCLSAISPPYNEETGGEVDVKEFYVYKLMNNPELYQPTSEQVPDVKLTNEIWALQPAKLKLISKIKFHGSIGNQMEDYTNYEILKEY